MHAVFPRQHARRLPGKVLLKQFRALLFGEPAAWLPVQFRVASCECKGGHYAASLVGAASAVGETADAISVWLEEVPDE